MANELTPSGDAVSTEIATIERTMREAPNEYWRDQGMQERYRGLISAREGSAPPPSAPSEVDKEITALQKLMRTNRAEYERSGAADRYLALLREREGQDEAPVEAAEWRAPPEQARRDLAPEVVAELDRSGDFAGSLHKLQDEVRDLLMSVAEGGEADAFFNTFVGLPASVQDAVELELSRGSMSFAPLATDEHLAALEAESYGPALLEAWGSSAARKFGIARARWARCIEGLSAADQDHISYFFNHLQAVEAAAVIFHLAG
jgi:hypothetical protein